MRSRKEILDALAKKISASTPEEKADLLAFVKRQIEIRMKMAQQKAQPLGTAITTRYRQAWEALLEEDRVWMEGLERLKSKLEKSD